jgi:hypothetical protein
MRAADDSEWGWNEEAHKVSQELNRVKDKKRKKIHLDQGPEGSDKESWKHYAAQRGHVKVNVHFY